MFRELPLLHRPQRFLRRARQVSHDADDEGQFGLGHRAVGLDVVRDLLRRGRPDPVELVLQALAHEGVPPVGGSSVRGDLDWSGDRRTGIVLCLWLGLSMPNSRSSSSSPAWRSGRIICRINSGNGSWPRAHRPADQERDGAVRFDLRELIGDARELRVDVRARGRPAGRAASACPLVPSAPGSSADGTASMIGPALALEQPLDQRGRIGPAPRGCPSARGPRSRAGR